MAPLFLNKHSPDTTTTTHAHPNKTTPKTTRLRSVLVVECRVDGSLISLAPSRAPKVIMVERMLRAALQMMPPCLVFIDHASRPCRYTHAALLLSTQYYLISLRLVMVAPYDITFPNSFVTSSYSSRHLAHRFAETRCESLPTTSTIVVKTNTSC